MSSINDMIYAVYKTYENADPKDLHKKDLEAIKKALVESDKIYSNADPTPLSDAEYDRLYNIYNRATGEFITGNVESSKKVEHDYPDLKGTIAKVHYVTNKEKMEDENAIEVHGVLENWLQKTIGSNSKIGFYRKYDGVSLVLTLDKDRKVTKAVSRGDKDTGLGQDKTDMLKGMQFIGIVPHELDGQRIGLKVEAILTKEGFKEYNKKCFGGKLVDPRAGIVSLINSDSWTPVHSKYVRLIPLMMQDESGKLIAPLDDEYGPVAVSSTQEVFKDLNKIISKVKDDIDNCEYNCDGIVVRYLGEDDIERLGRDRENCINKFEIAYKFPKKSNYTRLIDIKQDIGLMGKVSFTAEFEPFDFNGRTIKRASLGSLARTAMLGLAKGDLVNIKYEIIPYLIVDEKCKKNKSGNKPIPIITECPYCNEKLTLDGSELYCANKECPSRRMGKIYNFCQNMHMQGIGETTVEDLFHAGLVTKIEDLFDLYRKEQEVTSLEGYKEKTFRSIVESISSASGSEADILGSIGINNIGKKKAALILSIYHLDELLEMAAKQTPFEYSKLTSIQGVGMKLADDLLKGVDENKKLIKFLLKNITITKKAAPALFHVCFTGFRNAKFKEHLEKQLIAVDDHLSSKTKYLIAKDPNGSSSKITKAKELGIPVVSMEEAFTAFQYKY